MSLPSRFASSLAVAALLAGATVLASETSRPTPASSETRALWVVRDTLTTPSSITKLVEHAVGHGFNTLLVQVRGRGDAYYASTLEPRAAALGSQPASFDPLAVTLAAAHAAGLQVHAWVNVNLVSSAATLPSAREHVINRHPEWLMLPRALAQELGRAPANGPGYVGKLARWSRQQPNEIEGLFLSPITPAAADYTVGILQDLVRRYSLDGVHLDYLRYPSQDFDYSPLALRQFEASIAPSLGAGQRRAIAARARDDVLAWVDSYPDAWSDFRRSRLTALMMRIHTAVRAVRRSIVVSAAVHPDARDAATSRLQDWRLWAETGLLDVVCPMAYTTDARQFRAQIEEVVRLTSPAVVWAGIGAFRLTPAQAVTNIGIARASGARGIALFSYDAISGPSAAYLEALRRDAFGGATATQGEQR